MSDRFWSVARLSNVTDVEITHFDPEDDEDGDILEAYDVRMRDPTSTWDFCMDLPPRVAKMLYEKLKEIFEDE